VERLTAELAAARDIARQGRHAGREEALAIILSESAEDFDFTYMRNVPIADTGDYAAGWREDKLRALLACPAGGGPMESLLERLDGMYWETRGKCNEKVHTAERQLAAAREAIRFTLDRCALYGPADQAREKLRAALAGKEQP
jgi:hypothetical protein